MTTNNSATIMATLTAFVKDKGKSVEERLARIKGCWKRDEITEEQFDALFTMATEKAPQSLTCKVSEKGALSVYGLQRMPVTLYSEQWQRLVDFVPEIKAFLHAHSGEFSTKAQKLAAAEAGK
jgi:hypothetical protein